MRAQQISVVGGGGEWEPQAEEVGRLLAERGCTVVTGGLGEVMAAAARGAKLAGGETIGVLPGESVSEANEWIDFAVATGAGHARNLAVAASGAAVIAVGGGWGTMSEIAFARKLGRPVVVLDSGAVEAGPDALAVEGEGIMRAATPQEAVELTLSALDDLSRTSG